MQAAAKTVENKKPVPQWEIITPQIAGVMLQGNTNNRNLNSRVINAYAKAMLRGEWEENGETLKITVTGKITDGQHRLHAVIQSGVTLSMLVVRGVHEKSINTIDIGRSRKNADALAIHGYKKHNLVLAAAINICMGFKPDGSYASDPGKSGDKVTPTMALKFIDDNPGILHSLERMEKFFPRSHGWIPRSVLVALHFMLGRRSSQKTETFFHALLEGTNLEKGSPILALRNRLFLDQQQGQKSAANRKKFVALIIKAFKAFEVGRKIERLSYYAAQIININASDEVDAEE